MAAYPCSSQIWRDQVLCLTWKPASSGQGCCSSPARDACSAVSLATPHTPPLYTRIPVLTMGGECYRFIRLKSPKDTTTNDQQAFQALHPVMLRLVDEWRTNLPDPAVWDFNECKEDQLFRIKFIGEKSGKFEPLVLPQQLKDGTSYEMWRVGWQHRNYGRIQDPAEDLAEVLIEVLMSSAIGQLLRLDQEDSIWWDLHGGETYDQYNDGHSSPEDFAACDKECGYCGHCPY